MDYSIWIYNAWAVMVLIWVIASFGNMEGERKESSASRYLTLACYIAGGLLLFTRYFQIGMKPYPGGMAFRFTGFVFCYAGLAFAIWARLVLGRNWSGRISIKKGQKLIDSGPYGLTRNPIYTGLMFAFLGTAIFFGQINTYIGFLLFLTGMLLKMQKEEKIMRIEFQARYDHYAQKVKYRLIPYLY